MQIGIEEPQPSWKPDLLHFILLILFLIAVLMGTRTARGEEIYIPCIIQIESSGNPNAYNSTSHAVGLMQITPVVLEEWNDREPICLGKKCNDGIDERGHRQKDIFCTCTEGYIQFDKYNIGDLYNPTINIKIGTWYINERIPEMLKAYNIPDTTENRLIAYNFGVGNLLKYKQSKKKLPRETVNYIKKYYELTKETK